MCGIVGFVGEGNKDILLRMSQALKHRGPDADGLYVNENHQVYFGHRRLSILDIADGAQPMWDKEKTTCIIFNGEIYNHASLRQLLIKKGHIFQTDHSDTEVLIHGYKEWGVNLCEKLNGMFAFSILDLNKKRVFLARDRFGEKPLYYTHGKNFFIFASELSAIRMHPNSPQGVSIKSVQKFLAHGFFPAPHTLLDGVYKLPPASWVELDLETLNLKMGKYWNFHIIPQENIPSEENLIEELRFLLSQAVTRRLISDVPVGIFLSGGIDSSAVACLASKHVKGSLQTFTIGFADKNYDESAYAKTIADFIGTNHHIDELTLDEANAQIKNICKRLDEPIADSSLVPTTLLCGHAARRVKVALSGDGMDELFAGYAPFKALPYAKVYNHMVPAFLHKGLLRVVDMLPYTSGYMAFDYKLKRALKGLCYDSSLWNQAWLAPLSPNDMKDLFYEPIPIEDLYAECLELWHRDQTLSIEDRTLEFYSNFYLPDNILTKVDRASMINSLEVRAAFLDNDLVDFIRALPYHLKFRRGQGKYLLKKALKNIVPDSILSRSKKGFAIPLQNWIKESPPLATDHIRYKTDFVKKSFSRHLKGRQDNRLFLYAWNMLCGVLSDHKDSL